MISSGPTTAVMWDEPRGINVPLNTTIFRSRLARRIFFMFIASALVPVIVLACYSYIRVTRQLENQAYERLRQMAKTHGMNIYEHLVSADMHLQVIEDSLENNRAEPGGSDTVQPDWLLALPEPVKDRNENYFRGLALIVGRQVRSSSGRFQPPPQQVAISVPPATTSPRLMYWPDGRSGHSTVALVRTVTIPDAENAVLVGVLDNEYLWGIKNGSVLPDYCEVSVHDEHDFRLHASATLARAYGSTEDTRPTAASTETGPIHDRKVNLQGRIYLTNQWCVFLEASFGAGQWTVTVLEPRNYVLEPYYSFRSFFPFVITLALVLVVFLSARTISRNLNPIEKLMKGARLVGRGRFSYRVEVDSNDEFRDLAAVFNDMTHNLDVEFKVNAAHADLDRLILTASGYESVVLTVIEQVQALFEYPVMAVSLLKTGLSTQGRVFFNLSRKPSREIESAVFQLSDEQYRRFREKHRWWRITASEEIPEFLAGFLNAGLECFYVWPVRLDRSLFALVVVGVEKPFDTESSEFQQICGFFDHTAVAFKNVQLLQEFKNLNLGTLYALARTVDAKSPWTAGHSVRVTHLSMTIAQAMKLGDASCETLRRAGLLHDIGKIGIPIAILDKDCKLTKEEYNVIKEHPLIGGRILSPIQAYADVIPLIEQHHEHFDGSGYPRGLVRDQIHPLSRILALADSFDAMVSDRPYRGGLDFEQAVDVIKSGAGRQFDPEVVDVFMKLGPALDLQAFVKSDDYISREPQETLQPGPGSAPKQAAFLNERWGGVNGT